MYVIFSKERRNFPNFGHNLILPKEERMTPFCTSSDKFQFIEILRELGNSYKLNS